VEVRNRHKRKDIDRRVLDYRYTLLAHGFVEEPVSTQLNRVVSDEEIESYYQSYREDFVLRHNIFRGGFVVLPKNTPTSTKPRTLLIAKTEAEWVALMACCLQFAKNIR
jgi:hypothetical protein